MRFYGSVALALHPLPQPAIAKIRGVAVGAALNLALGYDLIAAVSTARFLEIFARRGLSLDVGGSWLLPRLVGLHRAKALALLAEIVSAEEALSASSTAWCLKRSSMRSSTNGRARSRPAPRSRSR